MQAMKPDTGKGFMAHEIVADICRRNPYLQPPLKAHPYQQAFFEKRGKRLVLRHTPQPERAGPTQT